MFEIHGYLVSYAGKYIILRYVQFTLRQDRRRRGVPLPHQTDDQGSKDGRQAHLAPGLWVCTYWQIIHTYRHTQTSSYLAPGLWVCVTQRHYYIRTNTH